jgi:hypothetical protein
MGCKALDALQLACAEQGDAEFFVTCDLRLVRAYRRMMEQFLPVEDPVGLVCKLEARTEG